MTTEDYLVILIHIRLIDTIFLLSIIGIVLLETRRVIFLMFERKK